MSRTGKDATQLNVLEDYLKDLGLFDSRNSFPNGGFTIAAVRNLSYVEVWKKHIENQWFDFRLDDNSLFFFHNERTGINFSFIGCPFTCEPFSVYKSNPDFIDMEESFIQESYEEEMSHSAVKPNPNYFRYDYEAASYREGEHPVAHLHCGLMDNVRIGLRKELDIMSFAAIVLRQVYIEQWHTVLTNEPQFHNLFVHKSKLKNIDRKYYKVLDMEQDYYLF